MNTALQAREWLLTGWTRHDATSSRCTRARVRLDSLKALEWRKAERLAGRLNAPVKGPRGLAALAAASRPKHSLMCKCPACFDPSVPTLEESRRRAQEQPEPPVHPKTKPKQQKRAGQPAKREQPHSYSAAERKAYGELMRAKRQREDGNAPRSTPIRKSHLYSGKTKPPE
jgi:hypothetical protein